MTTQRTYGRLVYSEAGGKTRTLMIPNVKTNLNPTAVTLQINRIMNSKALNVDGLTFNAIKSSHYVYETNEKLI